MEDLLDTEKRRIAVSMNMLCTLPWDVHPTSNRGDSEWDIYKVHTCVLGSISSN